MDDQEGESSEGYNSNESQSHNLQFWNPGRDPARLCIMYTLLDSLVCSTSRYFTSQVVFCWSNRASQNTNDEWNIQVDCIISYLSSNNTKFKFFVTTSKKISVYVVYSINRIHWVRNKELVKQVCLFRGQIIHCPNIAEYLYLSVALFGLATGDFLLLRITSGCKLRSEHDGSHNWELALR